jgi:hypothetical protein
MTVEPTKKKKKILTVYTQIYAVPNDESIDSKHVGIRRV